MKTLKTKMEREKGKKTIAPERDEMTRNSPYLPKSRFRYVMASFKANVAYRVWKAKLNTYGGLKRDSVFKLLEVGSGPGFYLTCAERWFPHCEAYGVDIDDSLVECAKRHVKNAEVIRHDGHRLPFADRTFDVAVSLQVIEHLERPERFFAEAYRVLKENGLLLIATPNPAGIPAKALGNRWSGYRYDHISLKAPFEWRMIIESSRFRILDDGTTGLTGFRILQIFPFALVNWIPMAIFGYFHWYRGESYMAVARKA